MRSWRISRGISVSAETTIISAAAANCVDETPIEAGDRAGDQRAEGHRGHRPQGVDRRRHGPACQARCASPSPPSTGPSSPPSAPPGSAPPRRPRRSGRTSPRASGEIAIAPSGPHDQQHGPRGAHRSDTDATQEQPDALAGGDRAPGGRRRGAARATTGPSTLNAPFQAIMTRQYWMTVAHSQVCERNSVHPLPQLLRHAPGSLPGSSAPEPAGAGRDPRQQRHCAGHARARQHQRPSRADGRDDQPAGCARPPSGRRSCPSG